MIDQDLLAALGVHGGEGLDCKAALPLCGHFLHEGHHGLNGGLLVVLNTDHDILDPKILVHGQKCPLHVSHAIQHGAGIAGNVGLALGAVDDEILDAIGIHVEFHVSREAGTAQAYDAAIPNGLQKRLAGIHNGRDDGLGRGHFPVGLNDYSRNSSAARQEIIRDLGDLAGYRGVNGGGHKTAGLGDEGADLDEVTDLHDGLGGRADMHGHGNGYGRGCRHGNGHELIRILSVRHVYPVEERKCHV